MKYFQLVWTALLRRKTRTCFTVISILTAFLLFGMLNSVRSAFGHLGQSAAGAERLQTNSKLSFTDTLPQALASRIASLTGVTNVAYVNWFGGAYQASRNQVFTFAVSPNYLDLYPEIKVTARARKTFSETRMGLLVGYKLAAKYHWKVGQKIPLLSSIYPRNNGSKTWPFVIAGIIHPSDAGKSEMVGITALMHWKYFDESNPYNRGDVGWYISHVADVNDSAQVAEAIDALSANSDHETRTRSEQSALAAQVKQLADVGLIVGSIMGAVFFTLLLLTGNTMAQAVRERTPELAVLKTVGFSNWSVLVIVLAESILLVTLGGIVGLALAARLLPAVGAALGGLVTLPSVDPTTWALGIGLMLIIGLLVGVLPAIRAMRLNVVDALARH